MMEAAAGNIASLMTCPLPKADYDHVLLGHGSGGQLTDELIETLFVPAFGRGAEAVLEDQATVAVSDGADGLRVALTTDSFVVQPLFFPGGDIGKLAVHGTVNDLAVGGAIPRYLAAAFIIEEGLAMQTLQRVVESMRQACEQVNVRLVTGDTKVVDRGKADQIFITTTGMGTVPGKRKLSIASARPGDRILVSGTVGDHGITIMSVREGIEFDTPLESDTAPLVSLTEAMLAACPSIRCMRDATRGGLASVTNELAKASNVGVELVEADIPVRAEVHSACEMLGLDIGYVANEGKLIAVAPPDEADDLLAVMRGHQLGENAAIIGTVVQEHPRMVVQRSLIGGQRVVPMLTGEQLPRIC